MKSLGSLSVNAIKSIEASETGIRLRFKSSCNRWFSSVSRLSFSSAMLCFLLLPDSLFRSSYAAEDIVLWLVSRGAFSGVGARKMWMRGVMVEANLKVAEHSL